MTDVIATFKQHHQDLTVTTSMDDDVSEVWVSSLEKDAIIAVLRTSLLNVAEHANASVVSIQLKVEQGRIRLIVQDNGKGFSTRTEIDSDVARGNGIALCRAYAGSCGARYTIHDGSDVGTVVTLTTRFDIRRVLPSAWSAPFTRILKERKLS